MAYELNSGRVYVIAFVEDAFRPVDITVTVEAGITQSTSGIPNRSARLALRYRPEQLAMEEAALGVGTAMAVAATASASTTLISGLLAPLTAAGERRLHHYVCFTWRACSG